MDKEMSERSRKPKDFRFSAGGNNSEKEDDDFMESNQSKRRKKSSKMNRVEVETKKKPNVQERKARNRLSEDEKYQRQLEEVLKMSLVDAKPAAISPEKPTTSQEKCQKINPSTLPKNQLPPQDSSSMKQDSQSSCIVQVEVLDSPNTKLLLNKKNGAKDVTMKMERRMETIKNEAALREADEITTAPVEDSEETGRRRSRRRKNVKEDEEDYKQSNESESEEEMSDEEESDVSEYEETPKKKRKEKVKPAAKRKKVSKTNKALSPEEKSDLSDYEETPRKKPKGKKKLSLKQRKVSAEKENKVLRQASPVKVPYTKQALPKTPVAASNTSRLLCRKSPTLTVKPGKFVQPGWTPPGAAGSKSNVLKSPLSPNFIRVGLSRNAKLTPLHPKLSCN